MTPSEVSMMFKFVQSITLNTSQALSSTSKDSVSLLLAILILGNFRVCILYGNIETIVDEGLGRHTTLGIPYINPYHCYIRFQRLW